MMRSLIVMATFLTLSLSLVMADTFPAFIKSIDAKGNKATLIVGKKKGEDGVEKSFSISEKVKVSKGKVNADTKKVEAGDAIAEGIKSDLLKENAKITVTTDADNKVITEIIVGGGKGKGKKAQ